MQSPSKHSPTPAWIHEILDTVDQITSPNTTKNIKSALSHVPTISTVGNSQPSAGSSTLSTKIVAVINFCIVIVGLAFSVMNAIYMASAEDKCTGYNNEERKFLFVVSIILAIFFGVLILSSIYTVGIAFAS